MLVQKAKESQEYSTPVNGIKGKKDEKKYNDRSLAMLDNYLGGSTMAIGKVVNKSAIFNAYMFDGMNKGKSQEYIKSCYEASSTLSSCSQISIDMAKKSFVDDKGKRLSLTKIMNQLNQKTYKYKITENDKEVEKEEKILEYKVDEKNLSEKDTSEINIFKFDKHRHQLIKLKYVYSEAENKYIHKYLVYNKKMIVPYFFKFIAKNNDYRIPTPMQCGMDYLEKILDDLNTKAMATDVKEIKELVNPQCIFNGGNFTKSKIDDARRIIDNCQSVMNSNRPNPTDNSEEKKKKSNIRKWIKQTAVKELKNLDLNEKTILRIVLRALGIDDNYKGQEIKKLNNKGEEIRYLDKKTGKEKVLIYREFKEMTMLSLTLMYNTYPKTFIECFKKKKSTIIEIDKYWK